MRRSGGDWRHCWYRGEFGCASHQPYADLRPNKPEEYKLPPEGTYTGSESYPKDVLNQFAPRNKDKDSLDNGPPGQSGRQGGMGGGGGGRP